jgi:hypothetical protein
MGHHPLSELNLGDDGAVMDGQPQFAQISSSEPIRAKSQCRDKALPAGLPWSNLPDG